MNSIERDVDACFAAVDKVFPAKLTVSPLELATVTEYAGDPPDDFRDDYQDPRSEFSEHMERGVRPSDFA